MDRLFVPLNTEPFEDFKHNGKTFELRSYGRQYTEKHVYTGRKVEVRKGYSGESLWGIIGKVETGTLEEILNKISYKEITPKAKTVEESKKMINEVLGCKDKYIAFEVLF
jgi:ASC-1-like (ASCH) protein